MDTLLVGRGLFESRSKAAASVMAGDVLVGRQRTAITKPGARVFGDEIVDVRARPRYVSRGGLKLERALKTFHVAVEGRSCLDVGASTGGFTDCLLKAGARRVIAVDVGYGDLHWSLRSNPRVEVFERTNVRQLDASVLPYSPDLAVADLSFIGLRKVLPGLVELLPERFDLVALVKPQFELSRESVGKGGVVRDPRERVRALVAVGEAAWDAGLVVHGFCATEVPGPAGNRESFIWCSDRSRGGLSELHSAAAATEADAAAPWERP